ncbi:MAG TPA: hypothetical protein VHO06_21080 [Polyangia bacterium]|jgi:hypothetical protein|nr:hypothetical protein [Polyangia bacterium]
MSKLNDLAARRRAAQHTADFCRDDVARKARAYHDAVKAQAAADDALEEADRALVEAQRETIGGVA